MKLVLSYICLALLIVSCKKDLPELPESNEPVFQVNGTIDGNEFKLLAGVDDAYMNANGTFENGVEVAMATLSGGENSFRFRMYDGNHDLSTSGFELNESDLIRFNIEHPTPLCVLNKDRLANSTLIESVKWFKGNEYIGSDSVIIDQPGLYSVGAEVIYLNGESASLRNDLMIGYRKNSNATIKHFVGQDGKLTCWMDNPLQNMDRIEWKVNGELVSDQKQLKIDSILPSWIEIEAHCHFINGAQRVKKLMINQSIPGMYIEDFTAFEEQWNFYQDYKAEISIDFNGDTYTTIDADNFNHHITITELDYHGVNEMGSNVAKVSADISCFLKNQTTGQIVSAEFTAILGMQIP